METIKYKIAPLPHAFKLGYVPFNFEVMLSMYYEIVRYVMSNFAEMHNMDSNLIIIPS